MKKFSIPVTWQVWDKVEVEAETIEEAIKYVKNNIDEIPLGTEPEYIDGTYKIDDGKDGEKSIEETAAAQQGASAARGNRKISPAVRRGKTCKAGKNL